VYPTDPGHLTDYLNEILGFAHYLQKNENIPTRMMLTLSNDPKLNTGTLLTQIAHTMASALSEGLTIGFQLDAYANFATGSTPPPTLAALKTVITDLGSTLKTPYIVSCDSEGFLSAGYEPKAKAANLTSFASYVYQDIERVLESLPKPSKVAVAGGSAANPLWSYTQVLTPSPCECLRMLLFPPPEA